MQIILNETKKDVDTAARQRLYSEMFAYTKEETKLCEEETKKLIYFYTTKGYYLRAIKSLGKSKDLFNNTYC